MRVLIRSLSVCVIVAIINLQVAYGHVEWKFGVDTPGSYIIRRDTGRIQFLQKTSRIPLQIPYCHKVTFVQVEVENRVSTPTVTYDKQALAVTISYSWLQVSYSTYNILVKGHKLSKCVEGPHSKKKKDINTIIIGDNNNVNFGTNEDEEYL